MPDGRFLFVLLSFARRLLLRLGSLSEGSSASSSTFACFQLAGRVSFYMYAARFWYYFKEHDLRNLSFEDFMSCRTY